MDEKGVSLNTSSFAETLELLVSKEKRAPAYSSLELNAVLRLVDVAPASVLDVLKSKPIPRLEYRALTRFVSRVAWERMQDMEVLTELGDKTAKYNQDVGEIDEIERIRLNNEVGRTQRLYASFSPVPNAAFWFWDEETKSGVDNTLTTANLPKSLFYAFVASVLSELPNISESRRRALCRDYRWGIRQIKLMDVILNLALDDIKAEQEQK